MRFMGKRQRWFIVIATCSVLLTWYIPEYDMHVGKHGPANILRGKVSTSSELLDWYNNNHELAMLQHNSNTLIDIDTYIEANVPLFRSWAIDSKGFCDGLMWNYNDLFLRFNYISVAPAYVKRLKSVNGLYHWMYKTFVATCWELPNENINTFTGSMQAWLENLSYKQSHRSISLPGLTIAIERRNITSTFAVVSDLYDVYLLLRFSRHRHVRVLFLDAHAYRAIDILWELIFATIVRLKKISIDTQFEDFIVAFPSKRSPLGKTTVEPPLLTEFGRYVLNQANIPSHHIRSCKHSDLHVAFVNRLTLYKEFKHDMWYVLSNLEEIINATRLQFPSWGLSNIHWDALSVRDRFTAVSKADILVAPPVPALAFAFLMQPGSAVLHLLPNGNLGEDQRLIESLVRSSGLYYFHWQNKHSGRDDPVTQTLVVPSYVILRELGRVFTEICH